MWIILLAVLFAAAVAYVILSRKKPDAPPHDTYVCDVCHEQECICRKEKKGL
jgi:hypothetical protein